MKARLSIWKTSRSPFTTPAANSEYLTALVTPGGREELEILEVRYEEIPMDPFKPATSAWRPNAG